MIKVEGSDREKPEPHSSGSWLRDRPTLLLIILCALSSFAWPDAAAQTPARPPVPEIKPTQPVKEAVSSLAYDPKGAILAVGRYARIEIHRSPSREAAQNLAGPAGQVLGVAFSPDGALLAAAGGNPSQFGEVRIWEVETWREVKTFRGHRDQLLALAFSPDGTRIATASYDRSIKLWDVKSGAELQTLKDHTEAVFAIAFSPDGQRLASASSDRTVKIWDVTTGERVLTLNDALDGLNTVAFHPQGTWRERRETDPFDHRPRRCGQSDRLFP
jgi:WD40 repeat protein